MISLCISRYSQPFFSPHTLAYLSLIGITQNKLQLKSNFDISPNEDSVKQYISGLVVQANRRKIKGFVKKQSTVPFTTIKRNNRLWSWLTKNKIFVRTTQLGQSRHVNIGWLLNSHAEYSNQEIARADLQRRMGRDTMDLYLSILVCTNLTILI